MTKKEIDERVEELRMWFEEAKIGALRASEVREAMRHVKALAEAATTSVSGEDAK